MTTQRIFFALTGINFFILLLLLAAAWPVTAEGPAGMLRGTGLEIVDEAGRLRATISIQSPAENGETVLLRLINAAGQPSVKIAASETGSGLSFVGGDDASYVILEAQGAESLLKMVEAAGGETVIEP